jgi:hypothetical protein
MANNLRKIEWLRIQKTNRNKIHDSVSTSQYSIVFLPYWLKSRYNAGLKDGVIVFYDDEGYTRFVLEWL